ncbi:Metal-dependent hydrolase, endonuclease/exonuclease/phosphatase family [Sphingobacterium wenxiniae]|uniref:Metal-dependent hydrolase, endonuclease/exonuclease/phosphatase family n=2 Tax=Sphingobacterium wenxiniae TaxID=683125 RepID=A0A1I6P2Z9_9SPHI|nr:Metal-dependent hydrolase, endonuclease/exonuclease/phosphatase family [Sphingobacterium wenxiniae]
MVFEMALHKKKFWNKVSPVLLLLLTGAYWIKTTSSTPYIQSKSELSTAELTNLKEGELSLLTYNIAGLPEVLSAASTPRASSIKEIAKKINRFDIVNVQEDFHYHKELYNSENNHPFRTLHKPGLPYGDGLNTLSKYPITETKRIAWNACHGSDCLAAKGFSFIRIQLTKNIYVDVYNVHATARDEKAAAAARQKNIVQLAEYINMHSAKNAVLVMGDFNAHFAASWDNLQWFTKETQLQDVWVNMMHNGEYPDGQPSFTPKEKLTLTDNCESIDKIFFRNSEDIIFLPRQYKIEDQYFSNKKHTALSDHHAVSCVISWKTR